MVEQKQNLGKMFLLFFACNPFTACPTPYAFQLDNLIERRVFNCIFLDCREIEKKTPEISL